MKRYKYLRVYFKGTNKNEWVDLIVGNGTAELKYERKLIFIIVYNLIFTFYLKHIIPHSTFRLMRLFLCKKCLGTSSYISTGSYLLKKVPYFVTESFKITFPDLSSMQAFLLPFPSSLVKGTSTWVLFPRLTLLFYAKEIKM